MEEGLESNKIRKSLYFVRRVIAVPRHYIERRVILRSGEQKSLIFADNSKLLIKVLKPSNWS